MTNVTKTFLPDKATLDNYINRIYSNGWITNNGELLCELERKLSDYLGVNHLLLVSNGTLALQIAYKALGLKGEVITTPFSFVATTSTLMWESLKPVFADIDEDTLNIDIHKIEEKITPQTSAILPVHVFGNACDIVELEQIAARNNLSLIFDAAHAFDVKNDATSILNFGDASILSFHATKIFHTIEGGAIIFKNKEHYEKARLLINFGISGYDKIDSLGINCKMNEFQAAMGLSVLAQMDEIKASRKNVWEKYRQAFSDLPDIKVQKLNPDFNLNHSYFPVIFESENKLLEIRQQLVDAAIFPRRYFYPSLNKLPYLTDYQSCPVSESIAERILCLPMFPGLDESIQDQVIEIILKSSNA